MTGVLRPMTSADHHDVLDLNERNVELLAPLDEPRLTELVDLADNASVIDVDGAFAGFVITFAAGSAYDGENFAWFTERYDDFCYLDRVVIHEDFRRRGLGSAGVRRAGVDVWPAPVRARGQPGSTERRVAGVPPRSQLHRGRSA